MKGFGFGFGFGVFLGLGVDGGCFFPLIMYICSESILTLYYFAFLRKMEFVTTCYVSVFTLS